MGPICRQILELIHTHRLDEFPGEPYGQLRMLLERGMLSENLAAGLLPMVLQEVERRKDFPMPLHRPPTAEQMAQCGPFDFEIGGLLHSSGIRVGLRILDAVRCINIAGQPGSGKTLCTRLLTTWINLLAKDIGRAIPQIIFDPKGGDYADLPHILGSHWMHLSVHDGMHVGLNAPEGVPAVVWVNTISTIIAGRMGMIAAATTLSKMILCLLDLLNPGGEPYQVWPDFQLLLDVAQAIPLTVFSPKDDYGRTLIRALEAICLASGNLFRTFNGLDIERDIIQPGRSAVIDMPNLPGSLHAIVVDLLAAQSLRSRIQRHVKVDHGPSAVLVIDEADQYASALSAKAFPEGMSIIGQLLAQGREEGLMTIMTFKGLNGVDPYVLSGAQYQMIFRQSDYESFSLAEKTLDLPRGSGAFLRTLPSGVCLFQMAQLGWPHAILLRVDEASSCRQPAPEKYHTHPFVPAKRLEEMPDVLAKLQQMVKSTRAAHARQVRAATSDLSTQARKLLDLASLHVFWPVARLWDVMGGAPAGTQAQARGELEKDKLAAFEEIRIGRTNVLLMLILEAGWQLLNKPPVAIAGRGGIVHVTFANWIRMSSEKRGLKSWCEQLVPGTNHPADVLTDEGGVYHAHEVVVSCDGNLPGHIRSCLEPDSRVSTLTIVTSQIRKRDELRKTIESDITLASFAPRLRWEVVDRYMKELWP